MTVLTAFSDQSEDYHRYKGRLEALRIQWSEEYIAEQQRKQLEDNAEQLKYANEQIEQANEQANVQTEQAKVKVELQKQENERLREILREAGLTPPDL